MQRREKAIPTGAEQEKARKKPYVKPAYVSEKIFEKTTALACAKRPGQGGACNAAPSIS